MNAFGKDIFREIRNTAGRFISLLIITMLGAVSVVGIHSSSVDMRNVADKLYKEHNLYDVQLKSTIGFQNEDIEALINTTGVSIVMPTYIYDVYINFENKSQAVRTYALPGELNTIDILEGRLPANSNECAVEKRLLQKGGYKIGDVISFEPDDNIDYNKIFDNTKFTIVGIVSSPLYISAHERGYTMLGSGSLDAYLYLHPDAYELDAYTDVYILMDESHEIDNLTDDYYKTADEWKHRIESTGGLRVQSNLNSLNNAKQEIKNGWDEYHKNLENYNDISPVLSEEEKNEIYYELEHTASKLKEAQENLDNAPVPEWFYYTRKDGVAYESYYQDTLRLQKIGFVFPLVFFLVAIMVSLTSMSRMVDEHRTQIGVYKALGYRPAAIMAKYLIYSFSAGFLGGMLGIIIGSRVFPLIITDAYSRLYNMPPVETPIHMSIGAVTLAVIVFSVVSVTFVTCAGSMIGNPAQLMRPKPPPAGKRVILEKIPFIWKRLNFIGKVTARNILRYKRRFFMTLTGIAGCSALLLTAFGLSDSIADVATLQYGEIIKYDAKIYTKELNMEEKDELNEIIWDKHLYIREESVEIAGNLGNMNVSLIIPEFYEELSDYINLYSSSSKTRENISIDSGSVILTEKLARVTGLSIGGEFTIRANDGKNYSLAVTDIVENYLLHYIYISPELYSDLFETTIKYNSVMTFIENEQEISGAFSNNDKVRAVVYNSDLFSNLSDSIEAMNIVTVVLIILACGLALIVLFNLININISERIRELATIKVLGFYDMELAGYIYRENGLVTLMGIALGLVGGIFLHKFVLLTVEIDMLKFPVVIHPSSYLLAVALSVVFAVFVNLIMNFKLFKIDMVESLKNVE